VRRRHASDDTAGGAGSAHASLKDRVEDLERLYHEAPVGMHSLDSQGVVVRVNRTELRWLGYEPDEMLGREYWEFLAPTSRAVFDREFPRFTGGDGARGMALELLRKDGRTLPVSLSVTAVRGADGRFRMSNAVVEDVTERLHLEQEIQTTRARFHRLVDTVNGIVWEADPVTFQFRYVNAYAERLLGYPVDRWISEPTFWLDHVHPDDLEGAAGYCRARVAEAVPHTFEYRMIAADGREVWIRDIVSVISEERKAVLLTGVMVDITEHRRAEVALRASERKYRSLYTRTPVMMHSIDRDGRLISVSDYWLAKLGYERHEVIGRKSVDFLSPASRRYAEEGVLPAYFRTGTCQDVPYQFVRKDGAIIDAELSATSELDAEGAVVRSLAVIVDVTDRNRAERALRESEARFQTLARVSPVGIYRTDAAGDCVYVNERWCAIAGLTVEEALGRGWARGLHPDDRDRVVELWYRAAREGVPFRAEYRFQGRGVVTWVLGQAAAERVSDGELVGYVGTITDITERKRQEEELVAYRTRLETLVADRTRELAETNRELESFSSSVSHDLRAPLRAIDAYSQLLLEEQGGRLDPNGLEQLRRVRLACQRMKQLVEDLLRLSQVTRGTIRRDRVDLAAIARAVAGDLAASDPSRVVEFVLPDEASARGDPDLLRIVLENLLGNAWKFTSHHPRARIEYRVDCEGGAPVHRVHDDGAGFDPAGAPRLFRAFERLHAQSEFEGTGIGLATIRRIVERHGGRVWAEGEVEKGATFSFTLGDDERGELAPRA
jgi:PAS domain S-box-containing protein